MTSQPVPSLADLLILTFGGIPWEPVILVTACALIGLELLHTIVSIVDARRLSRQLHALLQSATSEFLPIDTTRRDLSIIEGSHIMGPWTSEGIAVRRRGGRIALARWPDPVAPGPRRTPYAFVPGFLTSLGILGTFAGLVEALSVFDLDQKTADSREMVAAAFSVVSGMETAFSTSLLGLSTAAGFMLLAALTASLRRRAAAGSRRRLSSVVYIESPVALLQSLDGDSQQQAAAAAVETAESMGKAVEALTTGLTGFDAALLSASLSQAITDTMKTTMVPEFAAMRVSLEDIQKQMKTQNQTVLAGMIASLKTEVIEPLATRIDSTTNTTQRAAAAVNNLTASLGTTTANLASTVQQLESFQTNTLTQLQTFATSLRGVLDDFRTETSGVLDRVSVAVSGVITQAGTDAGKMIDDAAQQLVLTSAAVQTTLDATHQTMKTELTTFREEYQTNLKTFFDEQNALLAATLGSQREGLATVVEGLDKVFKEEQARASTRMQARDDAYEKQLAALRTAASDIQGLLEAVGAVGGAQMVQLTEAARAMSTEIKSLEQQYRQLGTQFEAALGAGKRVLDVWVAETNDAQRQYFVQLDAAAAAVCERLASAAEFLIAAEEQRRLGGDP